MTLEEKIDKKTDSWLREYTYKAAQQTRNECAQAFNAGCKEMLSELLPVMEQMKEAIEGAVRIKYLWVLNDINIPQEHHGEALAVNSMLYAFEQALEKYNSLFKKP